MTDDRPTNNDASESWNQRFERALWLRSFYQVAEAEELLQKLADESDTDEKKVMCLLWLAQVKPSLDPSFPSSPKKLLKLSLKIVGILYGGHRDLQQKPNHLLMRAFLLMAQAQFRLKDYRECLCALTQAAGCMQDADTDAFRSVLRNMRETIYFDFQEELDRKKAQDRWNCPHRHETPWQCMRDESCHGPSIQDQERWTREFWGCDRNHLPDECLKAKLCPGVDDETRYAWMDVQHCFDVIDGR
jgi:hypothetical protein